MSSSNLLRLCCCIVACGALLGCAAQHGAKRAPPTDSQPEPAEVEPAQTALQLLVRDLFAELERDAALRCPCLVAAGDSPSQAACIQEVHRGSKSIDCIEDALSELDDEALREPLECMLAERKATNACLATAGCGEQLTLCYPTTPFCPDIDLTLFTHASFQCSGVESSP